MKAAFATKKFGPVLRAYHQERRGEVTQAQLAVWLKVSPMQVSRIIRGKCQVNDLEKLDCWTRERLRIPQRYLWVDLSSQTSDASAEQAPEPTLPGQVLRSRSLDLSPELSLFDDGWDAARSNGVAMLLEEAAPSVAVCTTARLVHEWLVTEPPQQVELRAGRRIGGGLVARVERRVVQLRHLDDFMGGRDLHTLVGRELAATGRLLRDAAYSETLGRRLFVAIGELCQLAGRAAADAGRLDQATHYLALGIKTAHTGNDRPLAANLISTLAYQTSDTGSPRDGVLLAHTAARGAAQQASATTRALFTERVAWAHAKAGHRRQTEQALAAVEQTWDQRRPETDPEWVYWLDEDEITIMAARCYVELGQGARAVPLLTEVLGRYDEQRTREAAIYTSWLAEAHIQTGDIDQAAHLASKTARLTALTTSTRSDGRVSLLRTKLTPYRSTPSVDEFLSQISEPT